MQIEIGVEKPPHYGPLQSAHPIGDKLWGLAGGERGIRTPETVARLHAFQACAFSHSATSPNYREVLSNLQLHPLNHCRRGCKQHSDTPFYPPTEQLIGNKNHSRQLDNQQPRQDGMHRQI